MNRRGIRLHSGLLAALLLVLTLLPAAGAGGAAGAEAVPATAAASAEARIRLLSSTPEGVVLAITVPWQEMIVKAVPTDRRYVSISLPGWTTLSRSGAPALPQWSGAIGVPFGATLEVRVEPGQAHTHVLPAQVLPVATLKTSRPMPLEGAAPEAGGAGGLPDVDAVLVEDPAIYGASAPYPGTLAEVASDGVVRQQRVAGIAAYPLQYNPGTHELTIYESLTIHVTFSHPESAAGPQATAESEAYETLFRQSLLNYETARAWRQALTPNPSPEGRGETLPWAPPDPGWRVKVRSDGFHKLTYGELQAAGLPVDVLDPRTFRLFYLGSEVAIRVAGQEDGIFDSGDYILFYGQSPSQKYTRDNVYWLTYGGAQGTRMAVRDGTPGAAATPEYYDARLSKESNVYYITEMPGDEDLEHWIWDWMNVPNDPTWSYSLSLPSPYSGSYTASLEVAVVGYLEDPIDPDHHTQFYLNGTLVDDVWWDGRTWLVSQVEIPQSLLVIGNNTVSVVCMNDTGLGADLVYVDRVELAYANTFVASSNELPFSYGGFGTWKYRVEGFSAGSVEVYDVTDPASVILIEGVGVTPFGGGYAAEFEDEIASETDYWAMATTAYRTVQAIEQDTPSDLRSSSNGADYVTITHQAFWAQAQTLADFRQSQGLRTVRVDVQDVYDEFAYGIVSPQAIHGFLAHAYQHWQAPAPTFVALLGDGHYDPKDYYGYGRTNYVPGYLSFVDPWMGETAADNRYVTLVGEDTFPDMMLGRLSVNDSAQATALVSKIIAYEQSPEPGGWTQKVLAVADNADGAGDFAAISDNLVDTYLPAPYQPTRVYYLVTHQTVAEARQAILDGINTGALVVNYIGHAAQIYWASEQLFRTSDVPPLSNEGRLPVVLPMTCWDGYYILPYPIAWGYDSLGEVITRADGRGAVASWSPTGYGVVSGHDLLNTGFFEAVFQDGLHGLGQATTAGKLKLWATGSNLDLLDTYLLFGDPAMEINALDTAADLQVTKTVQPAGDVVPGDVLVYTLSFTNAGPATAHGVVLTDPMPAQLANPKVIYMSPEVVGVIPGTTFAWQIADLPAGAAGSVKVRGTVGLQTPPGALVNEVSIAGTDPDPETANNTAAVSTMVQPVMRVASIVPKYAQAAPGKYSLAAQVRVTDLLRAPVGGAAVQVQWTFPNGSTANQQGVTDLLGRVNFRTKSNQSGSHKLCVTGVTKTGVVYLPNRNLETCDSVIIP